MKKKERFVVELCTKQFEEKIYQINICSTYKRKWKYPHKYLYSKIYLHSENIIWILFVPAYGNRWLGRAPFYGPNVTFSANSIGRQCPFLLHDGGRLNVTVTSSTLGLFSLAIFAALYLDGEGGSFYDWGMSYW